MLIKSLLRNKDSMNTERKPIDVQRFRKIKSSMVLIQDNIEITTSFLFSK